MIVGGAGKAQEYFKEGHCFEILLEVLRDLRGFDILLEKNFTYPAPQEHYIHKNNGMNFRLITSFSCNPLRVKKLHLESQILSQILVCN